MKKLIGSLFAVAMIASAFMTTTFASGNTFTVTTNKDTYAAGETVTVTVELTGTDDFAGFKGGVKFDTDAFTAVSAKKTSRTDWDGSLTFGKTDVANTSGTYSVNFTNAANNPMLIDDEPAYYSLTYTFTAKSIVETEDFEFNFVCEQMINETFNELSVVGVPVTVTLEADEPVLTPIADITVAASDYKVSDPYAKADGSKYYNAGFIKEIAVGATNTPVAGITLKGANEVPVMFGTTVKSAETINVAINILDVPFGTELPGITISPIAETTAE